MIRLTPLLLAALATAPCLIAAAGELPTDSLAIDVSAELSAARKAWQEGDSFTSKARTDFSFFEKQEKAYESASSFFRKALSKDRRNPQANAEFARFWIARREFTQARAHLELALRYLDDERERVKKDSKATPHYTVGPDEEADYCRTLGALLERAGEYPQAMQQYRQALKLDPGNPRNAISLAIGLCAGGRPDEAITLLEPLAEKAKATEQAKLPSPPKAATESLVVYTLAMCLEECGRLEDALVQYNRALQLAAKAGPAENSGVGDHSLMAVARIEDLLDAMQARAKSRESENTERAKNKQEPLPAINERADFAAAAYRCAEGVKLKNIALSDESFVDALAYLRSNGADEEALNTGGLEKHPMFESFLGAMQAFQEATQKYPRFARAHYELALCNLMLGRYGSARALVDAAGLYSPNDLATLSVQGEVLLELGQWDEAASVYRRMLMLENDSGAAHFGLARALAGSPSDEKDVQAALDALDRAAQLGVRDRRMQNSDHIVLKDGRELDGKLQFDEKENAYLLHTDAGGESKTYKIKKERVAEIREQPGLRGELVALKDRLDRGEAIEKGPKIRGSKREAARDKDPFDGAGSIFQR